MTHDAATVPDVVLGAEAERLRIDSEAERACQRPAGVARGGSR
jgi:hypothetical protein